MSTISIIYWLTCIVLFYLVVGYGIHKIVKTLVNSDFDELKSHVSKQREKFAISSSVFIIASSIFLGFGFHRLIILGDEVAHNIQYGEPPLHSTK